MIIIIIICENINDNVYVMCICNMCVICVIM